MTDEYKTIIGDALNTRLASCLSLERKPLTRTVQQLLTNVRVYLTQGDWNMVLKPSVIPESIIACISARFAKLGVRSLHEQTVKWPIAVVLWRYQQMHGMPRYSKIYDWVQSFKNCFEAYKTPWGHSVIVTYPNEPAGLPDEVYTEAYPDAEDPPVSFEIPNFKALGQHVPLRSNSALLLRERQLDLFQAPMAAFGYPPWATPAPAGRPSRTCSASSMRPDPPSWHTSPPMASPMRTPPQQQDLPWVEPQQHVPPCASSPGCKSPAQQQSFHGGMAQSAGAEASLPLVPEAIDPPAIMSRFRPGGPRVEVVASQSNTGEAPRDCDMEKLEAVAFDALTSAAKGPRGLKRKPAAAASKTTIDPPSVTADDLANSTRKNVHQVLQPAAKSDAPRRVHRCRSPRRGKSDVEESGGHVGQVGEGCEVSVLPGLCWLSQLERDFVPT